MMRQSLAAVLLSVVLALASVTLALSRTAPGGMALTLCTGDGDGAVVQVDARGRPVAPVHPCPDCTAALVLAPPPAPPAMPAAAARPAPVRALHAAAETSRPPVSPPARGPPAA